METQLVLLFVTTGTQWRDWRAPSLQNRVQRMAYESGIQHTVQVQDEKPDAQRTQWE